ncbi:hypothetical protein L9F63_003913, partial [Diploptera punctata]
MADDSIQNGTNGGEVPEIELIIKFVASSNATISMVMHHIFLCWLLNLLEDINTCWFQELKRK